jgi:hypothetical protein
VGNVHRGDEIQSRWPPSPLSVEGFAVPAEEAPPSIVKATFLAKYRQIMRRAHGSSARLYNKQILMDHFKGKRSAPDPKVRREFQLLRQQAEIDWKEMHSGKNTKATPENIAEDYIHNAKLTADTQRKLRKMKWIALFFVVGLVVIAFIYALNQ